MNIPLPSMPEKGLVRNEEAAKTHTHGEVAKGDISNGLRTYFPELDDDDEEIS